MPAFWNKNEKESRRLVKQGHASMKEILTLSFGEWPPKGLDINPNMPHAQEVTFKPLRNSIAKDWRERKGLFSKVRGAVLMPWTLFSEGLGVMGRATLHGPRTIWMNKVMGVYLPRLVARSYVSSTLGHEAVHSLQGDNYYRADQLYGKAAETIWQEQRSTTSWQIMKDLEAYDHGFHKHILTRAFRTAGRVAHLCPGINYLRNGVETQAFFHEALAAGYKEWGRMPQDIMELWQALISMGITPPKDVKAVIDALPPDASARAFSKPVHTNATGNLKTIDRSLTTQGREYFWTTTLPLLYADLIEMYGDRKGRERFGFGPNTKGQLQKAVFGS